MADKKTSELNNVSSLNLGDLFAVSQVSGNAYASKNATLTQLANAINNGIDYTSDLNTSNKKVIGAINQLLSNFADTYSSSSTYAVDDCVVYGGLLYQCNTAITVAEDWDSSHWTQIKAVDIGSGGGSSWTDVTGTLTSGSTSITLSNASITTNSTINVYTSDGTDWNSISVSTGSVTITFDAQSSDLPVKVRVS